MDMRSFLAFFVVILMFRVLNAKQLELKIYHKHSELVKSWMNFNDLPEKMSGDYYKLLHHHDNERHGRKLGGGLRSLSPYPSNVTVRIPDLGYLYYTIVQLGSPNGTLLVALDTGSDLLWVPCDCEQCAPVSSTNSSDVANDIQFYSPSASKTSKRVACDNELCDLQKSCTSGSDQCPYHMVYASANTSSSGVLVQDLLYLTANAGSQRGTIVKAPITFGCGRTQTGQFLDGAAPYGLLGLGLEPISVPSILSKLGMVKDSFSICFPFNSDAGRFAFGEIGTSKMKETEFLANQSQPQYFVGIQKFYVGNATVPMNFHALFDSGTSFTYLESPVYKILTSHYYQQNSDRMMDSDGKNPFEFCFEIRNNQSLKQSHKIIFNLNGGNNFSVLYPLVVLADEIGNEYGYCLAVLENPSSTLSIIGQNFMTGYELIFNREKFRLGWKEADCSEIDSSNSSQSLYISPSPEPDASPLAPSWNGQSPSSSTNSSKTRPLVIRSPGALPAADTSQSCATKRLSYLVLLISLCICILL